MKIIIGRIMHDRLMPRKEDLVAALQQTEEEEAHFVYVVTIVTHILCKPTVPGNSKVALSSRSTNSVPVQDDGLITGRPIVDLLSIFRRRCQADPLMQEQRCRYRHGLCHFPDSTLFSIISPSYLQTKRISHLPRPYSHHSWTLVRGLMAWQEIHDSPWTP